MPKLEAASITLSIGLEQIDGAENVREAEKYTPNEKGEWPEEIIELAESIKLVGQLQPIVVKETQQSDNGKRYEIVAGFRRRAAFQYLKSKGDDFSRIEAKIVGGDKLVIQLVENIQRTNLSAREREAAVYQLLQTGVKQSTIAAQLCKSKAWVSVHVSAYEMRRKAEEYWGYDTDVIETNTLREFLGIPEDMLGRAINELINEGGTRRAASEIAYRLKKPASEKQGQPPDEPHGNTQSPLQPENTETGTHRAKEEPEASPAKPKNEGPVKTNPPLLRRPTELPEEVDHRVIDVNVVLTVVLKYIETHEGERKEAAKDVLAEIHRELDNA